LLGQLNSFIWKKCAKILFYQLKFKRLKTILGLGHLPKFDPESSKAWLHGKIVVALLTSSIVEKGRSFSPWGYPIYEDAN